MKSYDISARNGIYRSRNGVVFGVCRGLAEHFAFSVVWARVIAILFLFFSGLWPAVSIYLIAALIMKPAPVVPLESDAEREFYDSYTHSRYMAAQRLKRRFESLERRIRRIEHIVTTREFDWEEKL
jgi:phage shock protein C